MNQKTNAVRFIAPTAPLNLKNECGKGKDFLRQYQNNPDYKKVCQALANEPKSANLIANDTRLPLGKVKTIINKLKDDGVLKIWGKQVCPASGRNSFFYTLNPTIPVMDFVEQEKDNQDKQTMIILADIINDITKQKAKISSSHTSYELFSIKTANAWIDEAKNAPPPMKLFGHLWFENEVCILFADTNLGKTILATQIANSICNGVPIHGFAMEAKAQRILYFDFELSAKQFELRYSRDFVDHYLFDDNFIRVEINPDADIPEETDYETFLNQSMETAIEKSAAKVVIVDNITYLRNELETSKVALPLMKQLKALKKKHNLSLLLLAHTPKRDLSKPISRNDLQGSKSLINFCDSCFAIGESYSDKHLRYLKQIKQRNCESVYDSENVAVCEVVKPNNFLCFEFIGFGTEADHLRVQGQTKRDEIEESVMRLRDNGSSLRDIAGQLQISKSQVDRIIKKGLSHVPGEPLSGTVGQMGQSGTNSGTVDTLGQRDNGTTDKLPF